MSSPLILSDLITPVDSSGSVSGSTAVLEASSCMEPYRTRSREIMQLIDRLRDEGAAQDIDLPTIVFCGNQSSGKSSLIEAISGICLPRSDGTCTRCAMEVRMVDSPDPWNCRITLQYKYDSSGAPLNKATIVSFKENIKTGAEVEHAVRQAQKAILNPSSRMEKFQSSPLDEVPTAKHNETVQDELKFTANTILINMQGTGVNLTLIDLPGMISTTESRSERQVVVLIEEMVKRHISNPRSLIIATISCKDEVENQGILSLAQEVDPSGTRTIGVLTKPDTIENNCHDIWIQLLNNSRFALNLGYYIVKNPNKQDLIENIDFTSARLKEKDFFNRTEPWCSSGLALNSRMGVGNLREALSELLIEVIESSLPSMQSKVRSLLDEARAQLNKLPVSVSKNPKLDILLVTKAFDARLKALTSATSPNKAFYHSIANHFVELSKALDKCRPILILPESNSPKDLALIPDVEQYLHFGNATKSNEFTVECILKIIQQQRGREVGHFINGEALQHIVKTCQSNWKQCATTCLQNVRMDLKACLKNEAEQHFGSWPLLARRMTVAIDEIFSREFKETNSRILDLVVIETSFPTTYETNRFDELVKLIHLRLEKAFFIAHDTLTEPHTRQRSLYDLFEFRHGELNSNAKRPYPHSFPDKNAITIIENSQAYYSIAKSRFADNVSMSINHYLVLKLSNDIESHILETLGFTGSTLTDEECRKLLEGNPKVTNRRKKLEKRVFHLEEIYQLVFSEKTV